MIYAVFLLLFILAGVGALQYGAASVFLFLLIGAAVADIIMSKRR